MTSSDTHARDDQATNMLSKWQMFTMISKTLIPFLGANETGSAKQLGR